MANRESIKHTAQFDRVNVFAAQNTGGGGTFLYGALHASVREYAAPIYTVGKLYSNA